MVENLVELALTRAVNVTTTDYIRKFVAERIDRDGLDGPPVELVKFNVLVLCTAGAGRHMVDFEEHDLTPGTAIWIRPGQVQQWSEVDDGFDATVVVFDAAVVPDLPLFDRLVASTTTVDVGDDGNLLRQQMEWMAADLEANHDEAMAAAVVAVLLRLFARHARSARERGGSGRRELAEAFLLSVERNLDQRSVAWHANEIGSSTRSVGRATMESLAQAPKKLIDARVMLEAQRLLAWSSSDIGTIARDLRFSDASNFTKFFRQRAGISPSVFRDGIRAVDPQRRP